MVPTSEGEDAAHDGAGADEEVEEGTPRVPDGNIDGRQVEQEEDGGHLHAPLADAGPVLRHAELVRLQPLTCGGVMRALGFNVSRWSYHVAGPGLAVRRVVST